MEDEKLIHDFANDAFVVYGEVLDWIGTNSGSSNIRTTST